MVQSDPELASENRNLHIEKKRMKMLLHYQDGDSNPNDLHLDNTSKVRNKRYKFKTFSERIREHSQTERNCPRV